MPLTVIVQRPEWPTLGFDAAEFIERYLCHGPGDVQGEPFVLDDEEVDLLCDLYRLYPPGHQREGRRVVSRALYSRPKGRRKSELAGGIVCFEALGDCRFDGWGKSGRPAGRPVAAPFIRCLATEEEQSGNTYDNVRVMLAHALDEYPGLFAGVDIGLTRTYLPGNGEIAPSTSADASKDGGKESFAVADEEHLYRTPALKRMHRTVSRNLVKRKGAEPWLLGTTTMFAAGEDSTAETTFDHAHKAAAGKVREAGHYLNHREGHPVGDWDDDAAMLRSLVEAYGPAAEWMDLERILEEEIRNPEADPADSARYFLNQRVARAEAAFDPDLWRSLAVAREILDGEKIAGGFDGARFHDATALIATHLESGHQWVAGLWERPVELGKGDDWEVDETAVQLAVEELFDRWKVTRLYADPPYWDETVDRWAGRWPRRAVKWFTTRDRPMAYAVRSYATAMRTAGADLADGRDLSLSHDGDTDFARHIANARKRPTRVKDEDGKPMHTLRKEHPASALKIDAAMAGCLSWEARGDAIAAGALRAKTRQRARVAGF